MSNAGNKDQLQKSHPAEIARQLYDASFCIIAARFNGDIVERLVEGAEAALQRVGVSGSAIEILRVAGAYELPLAAQKAALMNPRPLPPACEFQHHRFEHDNHPTAGGHRLVADHLIPQLTDMLTDPRDASTE